MKVIGLSEAKEKLPSVINAAQDGPIVITRNGRTAAVLIVPRDDDDLERLLIARSKRVQQLIEDSRAAARRGETVTLEEAFEHLETP
jgi:prevent-host-death family protein